MCGHCLTKSADIRQQCPRNQKSADRSHWGDRPADGVSTQTLYCWSCGSNLNFWPPIEASNIRPPLGFTKTATPFSKRAAPAAPALSATADALAANSSLLFLNLLSAFSFSKTITSE